MTSFKNWRRLVQWSGCCLDGDVSLLGEAADGRLCAPSQGMWIPSFVDGSSWHEKTTEQDLG